MVTVSDTACASDGLGAVFPETSLWLANGTTDTAFFDVFLVDDQSSFGQLAAHIAEEQRRLRSGEPFIGYPGFAYLAAQRFLGPQEKSTLETKGLRRGTYGIVCGQIRDFASSHTMLSMFILGPFAVP